MFTFSDEFAGVGGFRIALEAAGGNCVFSSEIDKWARETYESLHGEAPQASDAVVFPSEDRPDIDVLVGGFPCPSFSLAGISRNNFLNRPSGFDDVKGGSLFFKLADILEKKQPRMFLFENVKNITKHDKGRTIKVISDTIEEMGYTWQWRVFNANQWIPQNRERCFMVGIRSDIVKDGDLDRIFDIHPPEQRVRLSEILVENPDPKYNLSEKAWIGLIEHRRRHEEAGHGFGFGLVRPPFEDAETRTLMARYHKDGSEILIWRGEGIPPRRLTPIECFRLQGFPEDVVRRMIEEQPVSDTQMYRQAGNSIPVPIAMEIARGMSEVLEEK